LSLKKKPQKPIPFKIRKSENHALLIQEDKGSHFYDQLHYHPEFQITAILQGEGFFYAGSRMTNYNAGDVLFIGPNVPHFLKNEEVYYSEKSPGVKAVSLFFDSASFGKHFFDITEMAGIRVLLESSSRVIKLHGKENTSIHKQITNIPDVLGDKRIISFLSLLSSIDASKKEFLNDVHVNLILNENEGGRFNDVLSYTFNCFHQDVTIAEIAEIAHLSRSQFSYFFKLHTGKTYIQFLNELRIEKACLLLMSSDKTVEQICYEVGFKNISNYIRRFKQVKGMTPSAFRKVWIQK
jgi:AraC-like DNA-binding protein